MISVVSYTHLGYQKDKKSSPTYRIVKGLLREGKIENIYALDYEDTYGIDTDVLEAPIPGGKFVPRLLYLVENLPFTPDARTTSAQLLDHFTSKQIGNEEIVLSFPPFSKTLEVAKSNGSTCIVYAGGAHPNHYRSLLQEEIDKYADELTTESTGIASRSKTHEQSYELADYIYYLSDYAKETFVKNGIAPGKLVKAGPLSAEVDVYNGSNHSGDEFNVLCLTDITLLKGVQYLLQAWNQLTLPDAKLTICGSMDDPSEELLLPKIRKLDDIIYEGHVDDPKRYYSEASILVHPSLTEGFSKVIAEGMASSLPVVITEHCQREFIEYEGFVVPIRDPSAIAEKIEYFYHNRDEVERRGRAARRKIKNNTWNDFSNRVIQRTIELEDTR
jgi:glycosyltransferase involved in cell wall biosynthesis